MEEFSRRGKFLIAACLVHLGIMAGGAAHAPFDQLPIIGPALAFYGELTGAGNGYGFFSPGVYGQLRAIVDVYDGKGDKTSSFVNQGPNREVDLRLNDIVEQFINQFRDRMKFQRSLAASLAGSAFARSESAKKVDVRIEEFTAPSRKDYLAGRRPPWVPVYSAQFIYPKRGGIK